MNNLTFQNNVKMSISLNADIKDEIDKYAREFGISKSGFITNALKYYLDSLDLLIIKQRLKDIKMINVDEMERFIDEMDA